MDLDRRTLLTLLSVGLVETLAGCGAVRGPLGGAVGAWHQSLRDAALALRREEVTPAHWQDEVESILENVDLARLRTDIDFEAVTRGFTYPDLGVTATTLRSLEGWLPGRTFLAKIFGMKRGRAIIPHGHRHMASAHLVLGGEFHLRQYDKVEEDEDALWILQTVDEAALAGSASSISDERNNIHWLVARSEHAFTFDILVLDIQGGEWDVSNIDPLAGTTDRGGVLRAPKLDVESALARYGAP